MPRRCSARRPYLNLASLIQRARHHPYHLRRSTIRRGLQMHQWHDNLATYSMAAAISNSRSMRQSRRLPRLRVPSAVANVSGGHLHLAEVEIAAELPHSQSRKTLSASLPMKENSSTIVLHRNPHFHEQAATRSGLLRLNNNDFNHNNNSINKTTEKCSSSGKSEAAAAVEKASIKSEPQEVPAARKKLKPKKGKPTAGSPDSSSNSSAGTNGSRRSASTSGASSDNSKSSSEESNSFDGDADEVVVVEPLAIVPSPRLKKETQTDVPKRETRKRKAQKEVYSPQPTTSRPPMLPHTSALLCPTLSTILLSVDNFLKRRRLSPHTY